MLLPNTGKQRKSLSSTFSLERILTSIRGASALSKHNGKQYAITEQMNAIITKKKRFL